MARKTETIKGIVCDPFTLAFIEAMLWAETGDDEQPLDKDYSEQDLTLESLTKIADYCTRFQAANADDIAAGKPGEDYTAIERAGHDFYLTHAGHGCGFWDGDWDGINARDGKDAGERLTEASKAFSQLTPYETDDGEIDVM
jgi:hypothetical protein